jgi:hypothetical protein
VKVTVASLSVFRLNGKSPTAPEDGEDAVPDGSPPAAGVLPAQEAEESIRHSAIAMLRKIFPLLFISVSPFLFRN